MELLFTITYATVAVALVGLQGYLAIELTKEFVRGPRN
jgi:hypothetical protein